jgi:hypothetical protein
MSHVGPALPELNHVGPVVRPGLPATNLRPSTSVAPIAHPKPIANARTDGAVRAPVVQPNVGTVGTAASVKPGSVGKPNVVNNDHPGNVGGVRPDVGNVKQDAPVVRPDTPVVVKNDGASDVKEETHRFRDLLGGQREVNIELSDNTSLHVWCRNDGQIGIACHDWNHGWVMMFVEDKNGDVHFIPPKKAKKPKKPSFISLYDPETNTTTTRTFNPDGTHTDVVQQNNQLANH